LTLDVQDLAAELTIARFDYFYREVFFCSRMKPIQTYLWCLAQRRPATTLILDFFLTLVPPTMPNPETTNGDINILQLLDVPLALLPKSKYTCLWCQASSETTVDDANILLVVPSSETTVDGIPQL